MSVVYLDSSAVVKRYVREPGSELVAEEFKRAYAGDTTISFSLWNVGEVLGAFDRVRAQGRLSARDYVLAKNRFVAEAKRLNKLGAALIVPVRAGLLAESWALVEMHHIYEADALQLATAKEVRATKFLSGDRSLLEAATAQGLSNVYLG